MNQLHVFQSFYYISENYYLRNVEFPSKIYIKKVFVKLISLIFDFTRFFAGTLTKPKLELKAINKGHKMLPIVQE